MFRKILFATDASPVCEIAAKTAFELSRKYGSELILLHVDPNFSTRAGPFASEMTVDKNSLSDDEYMAVVKKGMKKIHAPFSGKDLDPEYKVIQGNPSSEILKFARENKIDCIIMGVHAQRKEFAGKTLQIVGQKAWCPVMTITRPCETSFWYFNRIVLGTDFSNASMAAFQFAYKLAVYIGCKLHIFHALEIGGSETLDQKRIENQIKAAKKRIVDQYLPQMEDFDNYDIAVWEGIPYIELLKFSREKSADLIVMAHHIKQRSSQELFFGRTIGQVLFRSACPVINVNQHTRF